MDGANGCNRRKGRARKPYGCSTVVLIGAPVRQLTVRTVILRTKDSTDHGHRLGGRLCSGPDILGLGVHVARNHHRDRDDPEVVAVRGHRFREAAQVGAR